MSFCESVFQRMAELRGFFFSFIFFKEQRPVFELFVSGFLRQLHTRANSIPNGERITERDLEEGYDITRRSFSNFNLHKEVQMIDEALSSALCLWNTCVRIGSRPNIPSEELLSEIFGKSYSFGSFFHISQIHLFTAREIVCEVAGCVNSCQREPEREITLVTFLGILASRWFFCGEVGPYLFLARSC